MMVPLQAFGKVGRQRRLAAGGGAGDNDDTTGLVAALSSCTLSSIRPTVMDLVLTLISAPDAARLDAACLRRSRPP